MNAKLLVAITALGSMTIGVVDARAAPVYVGLQNGSGAITTIINAVNGSATFALTEIGTSGAYASGTVEGTPPLTEPNLLSNAIAVSGEHDSGATVSIYVTELNQTPLKFSSFQSSFSNTFAAVNSLGSGNQTANLATRVVEATYVTACNTGNNPCPVSDAFAEGTLLSTTTFTQGGTTTLQKMALLSSGLTSPYAMTEVYTITFAAPSGGNTYGGVSSSISIAVPEPTPIALIGAALIGLGLVKRRTRASPRRLIRDRNARRIANGISVQGRYHRHAEMRHQISAAI
jgi:hypothetical protein